MYIIIDIIEESMTYKFMNGWLVKEKDIDKIKKAILANKKAALEDLYVYGRAIRAEIDNVLNYREAIMQVFCSLEDVNVERMNDFAIAKVMAKYLVLDISTLCETEEFGVVSDNYHQLYDLLEGKF